MMISTFIWMNSKARRLLLLLVLLAQVLTVAFASHLDVVTHEDEPPDEAYFDSLPIMNHVCDQYNKDENTDNMEEGTTSPSVYALCRSYCDNVDCNGGYGNHHEGCQRLKENFARATGGKTVPCDRCPCWDESDLHNIPYDYLTNCQVTLNNVGNNRPHSLDLLWLWSNSIFGGPFGQVMATKDHANLDEIKYQCRWKDSNQGGGIHWEVISITQQQYHACARQIVQSCIDLGVVLIDQPPDYVEGETVCPCSYNYPDSEDVNANEFQGFQISNTPSAVSFTYAFDCTVGAYSGRCRYRANERYPNGGPNNIQVCSIRDHVEHGQEITKEEYDLCREQVYYFSDRFAHEYFL